MKTNKPPEFDSFGFTLVVANIEEKSSLRIALAEWIGRTFAVRESVRGVAKELRRNRCLRKMAHASIDLYRRTEYEFIRDSGARIDSFGK